MVRLRKDGGGFQPCPHSDSHSQVSVDQSCCPSLARVGKFQCGLPGSHQPHFRYEVAMWPVFAVCNGLGKASTSLTTDHWLKK